MVDVLAITQACVDDADIEKINNSQSSSTGEGAW